MSIQELINQLPDDHPNLTRTDLDIIDKLIVMRIEELRAHHCQLSADDISSIHAISGLMETVTVEVKRGILYIVKWGALLGIVALVVLCWEHLASLRSVAKWVSETVPK
jgi:hypothetical protein